jgi:hypothetical protein
VLYPEWPKLIGFADAAVPMVHDHEAIERVERLEPHQPPGRSVSLDKRVGRGIIAYGTETLGSRREGCSREEEC